MKRIAQGCGLLLVGMAIAAGPLRAFELQPGVNNAGVIEYPTALDQFYEQTVHGTVEIFDLAAPELALENFRYGYQAGAFQILADVFFITEPENEFDHGMIRGKLRILQFDMERTSVAVGGLARLTADKEGEERIENRPFSFLGIITTELYPFDNWGGILVNFYLDNRVAVLGLKGQLYDFIQGVGEIDFFHTSDISDREQVKAGIEIEGDGGFYFQVFWAERSERFLVQIGVGY